MAWSHSALEAYEQCPKRFYHTRIAKDVKDPPGPEAQFGSRVHKVLEDRLNGGPEIGGTFACYEPYAVKVLSLVKPGGQLFAERKIALTADLKETTYFAKNVWFRAVLDFGILNGNTFINGDWKGLPIDTDIPTPSGFRKMGELQVGNAVFDGDGAPCTVVGVSEISTKQCYRVSFDDKTEIVCDDAHLWALHDGSVVPITDLKVGHKIRICGPVQYPVQDLPIDPYVLGLWLADGKHTSSEICKPDAFVWEEIVRRGYSIGADTGTKYQRCMVRSVLGIRKHLTDLNLLGNKHVPKLYLRSSIPQRIDLLRGLMDGDGHANEVRQQAVFTTTDQQMSSSVKELLESLGQRVNQACTTQHGFGLVVTAWPLAFKPQHLNPFLLPRKADRISSSWGLGKSWRRRVTCINRTFATETKCIAVDSSDNTYLCGRNYLRTHNTGKRKPASQQVELGAATAAAVTPQADVFKNVFIWFKEKLTDTATLTRAQAEGVWEKFLPRVARLDAAIENNDWPAKPSGLCRKWCPCKACKHWGV